MTSLNARLQNSRQTAHARLRLICSSLLCALASVILPLIIISWLLVTQNGCATPGTYVLFAQNAREDKDMASAITLRLPFENQPNGAAIGCSSANMKVAAIKTDDTHIHVMDPDGQERDLEMPSAGTPVGLVTFWQDGKAQSCGLLPNAPFGTTAYIMWGEFTLFMKRVSPGKMQYLVGEDSFVLNDPLTPGDRFNLNAKHTVPKEIASILP